MSLRSFGSLLLLLSFTATDAQRTGGVKYLYPEKLHTDIELLRYAILDAHPDPYRYLAKPDLDALIDSVSASISIPMNVVEFQTALLPIFKAVGDMHCYAGWPADFNARMRSEARLIPLRIKILPEGMFLEAELKGFRSIPLGSEVISINGRSADAMIATLVATVICDGANTSYAERVVEREFPQRYHIFIEDTSAFNVAFRTPDGSLEKCTVFALTPDDIERSRKPDASLQPWSVTWDPEGGTAWVTMRTLDVDSLLKAGQRPDRFIDALLSDLRKNKAEVVVLDLRGAGGRELAMAGTIFAAFAKEPFKLLDDMFVRRGSLPGTRRTRTVPGEFYTSTYPPIIDASGLHRPPLGDPRLLDNEPLPKAFKGKLWVVCDGFTHDAAAALVMTARRAGRARIVGEEIGSNSVGFTGGKEWKVKAPGSGVIFHVPLLKYVPAGNGNGPKDRGEQPDLKAFHTPRAISKGEDHVKRSMLRMINELK